jgi:hypothetical protein
MAKNIAATIDGTEGLAHNGLGDRQYANAPDFKMVKSAWRTAPSVQQCGNEAWNTKAGDSYLQRYGSGCSFGSDRCGYKAVYSRWVCSGSNRRRYMACVVAIAPYTKTGEIMHYGDDLLYQP